MKKKLLAIGTTAMAMGAMTVNAFAASTTVNISGALGTGIADIQTMAMDAITSVAPVAISIAGAVLGVKIALRAFRSLVG